MLPGGCGQFRADRSLLISSDVTRAVHHLVVDYPDSLADGSHRQFGLERHAQLADDDHVSGAPGLWPPQRAFLTGRLRRGSCAKADRAVRPQSVSGAVGRPASCKVITTGTYLLLAGLAERSGPAGPSPLNLRPAARRNNRKRGVAMALTNVDSLDRSIAKTNAWLAGVAEGFGADDRRFACRMMRAWLHVPRDRLIVPVAAHFAAQLPELLRGVFYDGWNPSRVPVKYGPDEYVARFPREAAVHDSDVAKAAAVVTAVVRMHVSGGVVDEVPGLLPADLRGLLEPGP